MYLGLFDQLGVPSPTTRQTLPLAPFLAAMHYGAVRLLVDYGVKAAASPLNFQSYLLMHVIGSAFAVAAEELGKLAKKMVGKQDSCQESLFRQCAWTIIKVPLQAAKKVDQLYSKVFNIHTAQEVEEEMEPHELCWTEIMRKLFLEHVIEQALYISSWELGKRGAELLLKSTIVTIIPGSIPIFNLGIPFYGIFFVTMYSKKVQSFRLTVLNEQKAKLKALFDPLKEIIEKSYAEISASSSEADKNRQTELYKEALCFFEQLLNESKEHWKNYQDPGTPFNELDNYLEEYRNKISSGMASEKEIEIDFDFEFNLDDI